MIAWDHMKKLPTAKTSADPTPADPTADPTPTPNKTPDPSPEKSEVAKPKKKTKKPKKEAAKKILADTKTEKELEERTIPELGIARTKEQGKKLREAHLLKKRFDRRLDEMIALRQEFGNEVWNQDAVARGRGLSSDLLVLYKDIAKLGVLSESDETLIRQQIPADPLDIQPMSAAGQDPTMEKMLAFKQRTEADYQEQLKTFLDEESYAAFRESRARGKEQLAGQEGQASGAEQTAQAGALSPAAKALERKLQEARLDPNNGGGI